MKVIDSIRKVLSDEVEAHVSIFDHPINNHQITEHLNTMHGIIHYRKADVKEVAAVTRELVRSKELKRIASTPTTYQRRIR